MENEYLNLNGTYYCFKEKIDESFLEDYFTALKILIRDAGSEQKLKDFINSLSKEKHGKDML